MDVINRVKTNAAICNALGINDWGRCQSVTIKLSTEPPTVEIIRFVTVEDAARLKSVLERYSLVEKADNE